MSTLLRAIIFGSELIGFIVFCIFATISFWKKDKLKEKEIANKNLKYNIIYFTVNFVLILSPFLFSYPSLIFFSYNKMIVVTGLVIASSIIIMVVGFDRPKRDSIQLFLFLVSGIFIAIILIISISGENIINTKTVISEQKESQKVIPTMFSKNQIGYNNEVEGNINNYSYYYNENNDWYFKELRASEVKVIYLEDGDSYILRTKTNIEYVDNERKDRPFFKETTETYVIYINKEQLIEIKTD